MPSKADILPQRTTVSFGPNCDMPQHPLLRRWCKGFRMLAAYGPAPRVRRPASESLQGRKPRAGDGGRSRRRYGDLSAAGELAELKRGDATNCATVKLPTNERRMSSNCISWPTILGRW